MTAPFFLLALLAAPPPLRISVPGQPGRLLAADMNGDGKADIVAGGRHSVSVILTRAGGRMEMVSMLPVDGQPTEMASADMNGDGLLDIVYADHDSFNTFVLLGDGRGGLRKAGFTRARQSGRPHTHGLLSGDWNGDGKPDALHFTVEENRAVPLMGDGRGELSVGESIAVASPQNPVLVDVNADGKPDLVLPNIHHSSITVYLAGDNGISEHRRAAFKIAARPYYAGAADINNDGKVDIFATHDDISRISILLGDGKGGFAPMAGSPIDMGVQIYGAGTGDFNGDKLTDIAAGNDRAFVLLLQKKDGTLSAPVRIEKPKGAWEFISGDWNQDGVIDLAYSSREENAVYILWGPVAPQAQ